MKRTVHCSMVLLFSLFLFVKTSAQLAYSMHTLEQGETLSALAKTYHTTVGDIMRMNGMNAQSQLHAGDKIKIPASGTTVARDASAAPSTVAQPAATPKTHVVAAGETLYHISQVYKVPVDKLIALNNLQDGSVKVGQTLMLTDNAISSPSATATPQKARTETVDNTAQAATPPAVKSTQQTEPVKQPATTNKETSIEETKPQPKKESAPPTVASPSQSSTSSSDDNTGQSPTDVAVTNAPKEGFFTTLYGQNKSTGNEQTETGSAMTFKSASGWADKKYYILMNNAPTGSIVKVKSGKNELYAKVLWSLGEMKENDGLHFRISTAAAAALGIADQKFDLKVSYYE